MKIIFINYTLIILLLYKFIMDFYSYKKKEKQKFDDDIDKIFKKTVTKPYIYYLPLSEEEVKEKIKKRDEQNTIK